MSRRSHYRRHRGDRPARVEPGSNGTRPAPVPGPPAAGAAAPPPGGAIGTDALDAEPGLDLRRDVAASGPLTNGAPPPALAQATVATVATVEGRPAAAADASPGEPDGREDAPVAGSAGCTAPQLRRFIKSRAWVPMHELRRRFGINGHEDDVTPVAVDGSTIFVGLPPREGQLLGELLRAGDIGYELSLDPRTPIVIGVYPMRPVPRH